MEEGGEFTDIDYKSNDCKACNYGTNNFRLLCHSHTFSAKVSHQTTCWLKHEHSDQQNKCKNIAEFRISGRLDECFGQYDQEAAEHCPGILPMPPKTAATKHLARAENPQAGTRTGAE